MNVHVGERVGPFVVVANESTIPARKRRVVVRCVVCERVSEMNERSLLDKRTEEQRACAKCRVYTTNGTWTKGWRSKMENAAIEANRLNKENADLRDEIDKVLRERDEALARCETLRALADEAAYEQGLAQRRMMDAQRERDEARAEVEHAYREGGALYEAKIAEREAFRCGAEAMREACAEACRPILRSMASRAELAETIRALPIPEDK